MGRRKKEIIETSQDVQIEDSQDVQIETSQDVQIETSQDVQTEDSQDVQTEDSQDVQIESIAKNFQSSSNERELEINGKKYIETKVNGETFIRNA